ncbi:glycosyltransferase family 4 protein [Planococcus sp. FY231025]|uniref:glycosyltransferase family 4 protein n=1 Tax=Planococcus sp. FY231025 TaxID=3455699 RepID=UPI003F930F5C
MKLLHICSYYIGNKLYSNLFNEIYKEGVSQEIYIPIKNEMMIGKNKLNLDGNISFHYEKILTPCDRILYMKKIKKQCLNIEKKLNIEKDIDFIHAHTVYSDGGTAYLLNQKYGKKYIVNVRNTDINIFWKYGLHLRKFMIEVLLKAEGIIFLSPAYMDKTMELLPKHIVNKIEYKCKVIPNGIDQFWLDTKEPEFTLKNFNPIKLIYIGALNKNKNIEAILKVCSLLKQRKINVSLNIVGSGDYEFKLKEMVKSLEIQKQVKFHGFNENKTYLKELMDKSDIFIMPSIKETFGLVYIEAMSRGLPVIYSESQAIDGYFPDGSIGYAVEPFNIKMIANRIIKVQENYTQLSKNCLFYSKKFNWKNVKNEYINMYNSNSFKLSSSKGSFLS